MRLDNTVDKTELGWQPTDFKTRANIRKKRFSSIVRVMTDVFKRRRRLQSPPFVYALTVMDVVVFQLYTVWCVCRTRRCVPLTDHRR